MSWVGVAIAGGSGLMSYLGQKSQNDQISQNVDRARSGVDMSKAIENAYAPWYGRGWQGNNGSMNRPASPGASLMSGGTTGGSPMPAASSLSQKSPQDIMALLTAMVQGGKFPGSGSGGQR